MSYQAINRGQLRQLLKNQLGAASNTFWRDTELNFYLQEGLRFFNLLLGYWKTRVTLTTGPATIWYALPNAINSGLRVTWQGQPLLPCSAFDMDYGRDGWENETTASGGDVPTQPVFYIPGGLNLLGIWPGDAAGNNQLVIDGLTFTPILANDSDFVDIGQEELTGLLDLCQAIAVFKEGGKEFQDSQGQLQTFMKFAAEKNAMFMASAAWRAFLGINTDQMKKPMRLTTERVGAR